MYHICFTYKLPIVNVPRNWDKSKFYVHVLLFQPITISAEPDLPLSNGLAWGAWCLADPSLTLWTSRIPCTWKLCCLQETLNSRRKPIYIQNGRSWLIPRPASFPSRLRIASQWVDANCPLPIHVQICFLSIINYHLYHHCHLRKGSVCSFKYLQLIKSMFLLQTDLVLKYGPFV